MAEQINQNKYLAAIKGSNVIEDDAKVKAEVAKIIEEHAAEKLEKSGADALLLNAPVASDSGFGRDCVRFALVEKGRPVPPLAMGEKVDLAETILNFCLERLNG